MSLFRIVIRPVIGIAFISGLIVFGAILIGRMLPEGDTGVAVNESAEDMELYLTDLDRELHKRLTFDNPPDDFILWSPDGTQIARVSLREGREEIWVTDADGRNLRDMHAFPGCRKCIHGFIGRFCEERLCRMTAIGEW